MSFGAQHRRSPAQHRRRIAILPTTFLGRWAVKLAIVSFPLVFAASVVPRATALGFLCGVAGGVGALVAILRGRERALSVFAAVLPLAVAFALTELIAGP